MSKKKILFTLIALAAIILSVMNASWFAPAPGGRLMLIAHRGVGQRIDPEKLAAANGCDARAIRDSDRIFIENTQFSMQAALHEGADGLLLDVHASADGAAMIFRDATLECRTNGTGRVGQHPLAYLKSLDVGYGYTPDNGRTFPLRGGTGGMLTLDEVLTYFGPSQLIFDLADARAAEAAVAAFARAQVAIGPRHGFTGPPEALARLRQLTRGGWTLDRRASAECVSSYRLSGLVGIVPTQCRGLTLELPYNGGWTLWGWPYRLLHRVEGAGGRWLLSADPGAEHLTGLDQPEQLGEVPRLMTGMLLVEDMEEVGRALVR